MDTIPLRRDLTGELIAELEALRKVGDASRLWLDLNRANLENTAAMLRETMEQCRRISSRRVCPVPAVKNP